ncbi:hypothetical protein PHYBOEH_001555 [Phytophthora boehmeriae]|uniref:FYVE-type domain-containing protein n=1 Tax=Phytophthora boehmeriae TaxID=109152 RepID=A0A8T1WUU0_9STRA|nr:hypothetical protein PHYBOEH_001555 [Phytophthora boehmeriae]
MTKERFTVNPFEELGLTPNDRLQLQDLANSLILDNLAKFSAFPSTLDPQRWKLIKDHHNLKMYTERSSSTSSDEVVSGNGLPIILGIGTLEGKLDDLMFGAISSTLEEMRIKASYVDDFSGAAVLDTIVEPTPEEPFLSLLVKWMEVDIPFASTSLVKNRDYVYIEGTGFVRDADGSRVGYHLIHSVNFPKTQDLPGRIRANMSAVAFWQQSGSNVMKMWATAVMDPGGNRIRKVFLPAMAGAFMSATRFAYCGQMKKLAWMLERRYEESKLHGAPNAKNACVTCSAPSVSRRTGDFGKNKGTCKLCFGYVCSVCKVVRKISFVGMDLLLSKRKVTFCTGCVSEVTRMSAIEAARSQIVTKTPRVFAGILSSTSSED